MKDSSEIADQLFVWLVSGSSGSRDEKPQTPERRGLRCTFFTMCKRCVTPNGPTGRLNPARKLGEAANWKPSKSPKFDSRSRRMTGGVQGGGMHDSSCAKISLQ